MCVFFQTGTCGGGETQRLPQPPTATPQAALRHHLDGRCPPHGGAKSTALGGLHPPKRRSLLRLLGLLGLLGNLCVDLRNWEIEL